MAWNRCPHCKKAAMNFFEKAFRGSRKSYPCNSCGEPVGISNWARLVGLLMLISIFGFAIVLEEYLDVSDDLPNIFLSILLALTLAGLLQAFVVPVVIKNGAGDGAASAPDEPPASSLKKDRPGVYRAIVAAAVLLLVLIVVLSAYC